MTILRWAGAMALALLLAPCVYAQTTASSVQAPAGYAPMSAICVKQANGTCIPIGPDVALPTAPTQTAATSTPLAGSIATSQTVGPFTPQLGRPINLTLSGSWAGGAQLLRSIDSGVTKTALTVGGSAWGSYAGNVNEPVWTETEAGATYYLALTVSSGTLTYRVAQ